MIFTFNNPGEHASLPVDRGPNSAPFWRNLLSNRCQEAKRYKQAFVWNWRVPSCLPQSSLRFPLVTLCVRECGPSVCRCVCMCLCVCDWECASVFRRCCFPQPWSNSVVTQSPCERFPASVLPPVDRLSLAGWVAECVWQRPAQSHWTPLPLHALLLLLVPLSLRSTHPPIRIDLLCQPLGLSAAATFAAVPASCVHTILTSYTCHSTTATVGFVCVHVCV